MGKVANMDLAITCTPEGFVFQSKEYNDNGDLILEFVGWHSYNVGIITLTWLSHTHERWDMDIIRDVGEPCCEEGKEKMVSYKDLLDLIIAADEVDSHY